MFLPVLLLREYGIAGWVVFAVPNVPLPTATNIRPLPPGPPLSIGMPAPDSQIPAPKPFGERQRRLSDLKLTSWRYLGHPPQRFLPRALRKLAIARGFMVYEGLR